ncbi:hypothetical protein ACFL0M_03620 [Thermodesulfobacteriota bacterium]
MITCLKRPSRLARQRSHSPRPEQVYSKQAMSESVSLRREDSVCRGIKLQAYARGQMILVDTSALIDFFNGKKNEPIQKLKVFYNMEYRLE